MKKAQMTFTGIKIAVGLVLSIVFAIGIYYVMMTLGQGGTQRTLTHLPLILCLARTRLSSRRVK